MLPRLIFQILAYLIFGPRLAIRTVGAQCIPNVHDGEDACQERNLFALQSARIARSVPFGMSNADRKYTTGESSSSAIVGC